MTLSTLNSQRFSKPHCNPSITSLGTIQEYHNVLRKHGCTGCELGCQPDFYGPVVYRGNPEAKKIIIGEAPGLHEDKKGKPFVGPAGKLLDTLFTQAGWNIEKDWLITNCVFCRPKAPQGSGRQNLTPQSKHHQACRPYISQILSNMKPEIVVLLGKTAAQSIMEWPVSTRMSDIVGKIYIKEEWLDTIFYVMYHPAALLHNKGQVQHTTMNEAMNKHLLDLRQIIKELR